MNILLYNSTEFQYIGNNLVYTDINTYTMFIMLYSWYISPYTRISRVLYPQTIEKYRYMLAYTYSKTTEMKYMPNPLES